MDKKTGPTPHNVSAEHNSSTNSTFKSKVEIIDIEIGPEFFSDVMLPMLHTSVMCNVKAESKPFFNLMLAMRIALQQKTMSQEEYNFILTQLVALN